MHIPRTLVAGLLFVGSISSSLLNAEKPNILFIAVDDLKPLIGAYDSPIPTPNIDRIAERGTTFLNAHCQQAVCGPSRASLMTGMRPDATRVWDLQTKIREAFPEAVTLPEYLRANGYHTAGVGKIYDPRSVDRGADSASWSQPYSHPWQLNYSDETGKPSGHYHNANSRRAAEEAKAAGISGWGPVNQYLLENNAWPAYEAENVPDDAYDDGAIARYAVSELSVLAAREQPFFFAIGFKKPHLPFAAPKKYWDLFDPSEIILEPFQSRATNSPSIAYHTWGELRSYSGIPQDGPLDEATQRNLIHGYYACVAYIDAQVGLILDELDQLGLSDNTILVFWGDHGFHLGDHGLWCKHSNFEQATRVPLIISSPSGMRDAKTTMPAELTDIFPTLLDLSGLPSREGLDGVSLSATITEGRQDIRDYAISQYPRRNSMGYALRTQRFRYVAWYETGTNMSADGHSAAIATELYDYQLDPNETRNLASDQAHEAIAEELGDTLTNFLKEYANR